MHPANGASTVMMLLSASLSVISFVGLTLSLWLGIYVVTRSPRSRVSWLASATLWSLSVYFLSSLTYLHSPPQEAALPWWLGWSVVMAVPFWFHLSLSLRRGRPTLLQRFWISLVYLLALNIMGMLAYTDWIISGATGDSPLFYSALQPGSLFPLLGLYLLGVPALSLYALWRGWSQATSPPIRRQFAILLWATALAAISGAYTALSVWLGLDAPVLFSNLCLSCAVALLGYGVARYSALLEGRLMAHDFAYSALAAALVIGLYLLVALVSDLVFDVPFIAFIMIILLAIVSHSLYDWARTRLDRLLYRRQYGDLRARLRQLARAATPDQDMQHRLQVALNGLCQALRASKGFVALREGDDFTPVATWRSDAAIPAVAAHDLVTDELVALPPPGKTLGMANAVLIAPLHAGGDQMGAIVLGRKNSGLAYTEDDLEVLEECADTLGGVIYAARLQEHSVQRIDALLREVREREQALQAQMRQLVADTQPPALADQSERESISAVEEALRHLYDYGYLGEQRLAGLRIVESHLDLANGAPLTHLDRGRALQRLLVAAIDKLKPSTPQPSPPGREWYQYTILHDCYVLGRLNRDVMSDLFIGEGTFNRARRRAIRAVTKALVEMEAVQTPTSPVQPE
jgi:GAF domain-containing protein